MSQRPWTPTALALALTSLAPLAAQQTDFPPDMSKFRVEQPLKEGLAPGPPGLGDLLKSDVEWPLKLALRRSVGQGPADLPPLEAPVPAGTVRWHDSYEAALAAARESGRPVLLFQLLGRLDEEFC